MGNIWTDKNRFSKMLEVEILAVEAMSKLKKVPKKDLAIIKKKARFNIEKIKQIERKTHHDVIAFLENIASYVGPSSRFIHLGLTSSDVLDTALSIQMREAADIIIEDLKNLSKELKKKARRYKDTVMVGRSHGVHAEPTTFGLKMTLFYDETQRNIKRLEEAKEVISVGKISGSVGTYANTGLFLENYVCKKLGLKAAKISTQIIQRDRIAQLLSTIAIVGSSLEKMATEIRHLQRTEVLEAEEPFRKGQKGSSSMPHKRNPIICERIAGLARLLRTNALAAMENVTLWHERDISHSSVERVIIPDSTILIDYMLVKMTGVIKGLLVYPKRMQQNLAATKGLIFSQRVMIELAKKGMDKKKAYEAVQKSAMSVWRGELDFKETLKRNQAVRAVLTAKQINACFDLGYHLKHVDKIFRKVGIK